MGSKFLFPLSPGVLFHIHFQSFFFIIINIPVLTLPSVCTLSSFCAYWFLLSITSSTRIQTKPFAWLPVNIKKKKKKSRGQLLCCLPYTHGFHVNPVCAVWLPERWWSDCWPLYVWGILTKENSALHNFTGSVVWKISYEDWFKSPLHAWHAVEQQPQNLWKKLWDVSLELDKQWGLDPGSRFTHKHICWGFSIWTEL